MENKVDILFYARSSKKNRKGLTLIYGRLVVNGERWDFATGFSIGEGSRNGKQDNWKFRNSKLSIIISV